MLISFSVFSVTVSEASERGEGPSDGGRGSCACLVMVTQHLIHPTVTGGGRFGTLSQDDGEGSVTIRQL